MRRLVAQIVCERCGRPAEGIGVSLDTLWTTLVEQQGWELREIDGTAYELCGPREDGDELVPGCASQRFDP